jgi:hypothetical protein
MNNTKKSLQNDNIPNESRLPVLLIVFNRPKETGKVLQALKQSGIRKLYIHGDGPRTSSESDLAEITEVWNLVSSIDWECEVHTKRSDKNLGCGNGVFSAVSWFFQQEERGIILEDDVLPSTGLFLTLERMLSRLEENEDVGAVSGFNWTPRNHITDHRASFHFSNYAQSLAWGTWKKAWEGFSLDPQVWQSELNFETLQKLGGARFARYWLNMYEEEILSGKLDTWDVQWGAYNWSHGRKFAVTNNNFALHIGFNERATHTRANVIPDWHPKFLTIQADELVMPDCPIDKKADRWANSNFYPINFVSSLRVRLRSRIWSKLPWSLQN